MSEVSTTGGSSAREPIRWGFGTPGALRDKLTALAFGGGKVVTSDLLANYEIEGEPVEQPGDISILLDSDERPVAMIEDVRSIVIRLADMTDEDAIDEGEGYADAGAPSACRTRTTGTRSSTRFARGSGTRPSRSPTTRRSSSSGSGSPPSSGPMGRRSSRASAPPTRPIAPAVDAFLAEHNADVVARRGELVDARTLPGADRRVWRRHRRAC